MKSLEVTACGCCEEGLNDVAVRLSVVRARCVGAPYLVAGTVGSCLAGLAVRWRRPASSPNGTPNTSCSTNANRSAGDSRSSTTASAELTASTSSASTDGSRVTLSCRRGRRGRRLANAPLAEHVDRDSGDHSRQPAGEVFDRLRVATVDAEPGLLDGVVSVVRRSQQPVRDGAQSRTLPFEKLFEPLRIHVLPRRSLVRHVDDVGGPVGVTPLDLGEDMTESLHRELTLQAPVGRVWRALTDSAEIADWMYPNDFKPEGGHGFTLKVPVSPQADYGPSDGLVRCEVVECVPEVILSYTWSAAEVVGTKGSA
jgi:hypothetical protein